MPLFRHSVTSIDTSQALRYLGHHGQHIDDDLCDRIEHMAARCIELAHATSSIEYFSIECNDSQKVDLTGCELVLNSSDIATHLHGAQMCALMAVTLGAGIDQELRRLSHVSPLDQVVFDACASEMVERAADAAEAEVVAYAHDKGLFINWRYSPGYGDFALSAQPELLRTLDASRRLGLTTTSQHLLIPTKSVTAVIGLFDEPQEGRALTCAGCRCYDFCTIRTSGRTCRG